MRQQNRELNVFYYIYGKITHIWIWDFGNGERKEIPNAEERKRAKTEYTMPGLYTVSLSGKQGELSGTETKIGYIYIRSKMQ